MAGKKQKQEGVGAWVAIVILFAVGLWPIALVMLLVKLFGNDGQKRRQAPPPLQTAAPEPAAAASAGTAGRTKKAVRSAMKSPAVKKSNAKWLKIIGAVLAVCGLAACWSTIEMMIWLGGVEPWYIEELLWALAIAAAGGAMFCSGVSIGRSLKRYNKYLAVVGNYEAMAVEQLCRTLGYSRDRVEKDLQKMIDKGYFGDEAYLNMELGYLFRSGQADADLKQKRRQEEAAAAPPPQGDGGGLLRNPAEDPPGQRRHRGPGTLCQDRPAGDHHRQDLPGGGGGPEEARPDRYLLELLPAYYPEAVGLLRGV